MDWFIWIAAVLYCTQRERDCAGIRATESGGHSEECRG